MFSKVLRKAPDQAKCIVYTYILPKYKDYVIVTTFIII